MTYEHPLTVTIPIPEEEPRQQGIYSTKHPEAAILYARVNRFENILIDNACKDLNIKPGTFVRFCIVHVAQELDRLKNDYLKSHKSG